MSGVLQIYPVNAGGGGGPGVNLVPARTLYVSTAWPAGADPLVFFTSIAPAEAQALALVPTAASPVEIIIFPGVYPGAITLVSNVHLVADRRNVIVTGVVVYTPGAGVNAPQTAALEFVSIHGIDFEDLVTCDATGKAGNLSTIEFRDCGLSTTVHVGRAGLFDRIQIFDCIDFGTGGGGGGIKMTGSNGNLYHSFFLGIDALGSAAVTVQSHEVYGTVTVVGPAAMNIDQTDVYAPIIVGPGATFTAVGSSLTAGVSSAAGAMVDIRDSEYYSPASIVGPGPIDRSIYRFIAGPTAVGPNVILFTGIPAPLYSTGFYNVQLTDNAGAGGGALPSVTGKAAIGFTLNDPTGGRTFDVTVLKE